MFNNGNRIKNSIKSTILAFSNQLMTLILAFVYRTIFLNILSSEYLGLNGLFNDILGILSLAELGIGSAIIYRMYKPIASEEVEKVAALLDFYKKVYRIVMLVITLVGLSIMPFIKFFIKSDTPVPSDVNLYIVYGLFILQTISSYMFVYKQSILIADQKNYLVSLFTLVSNIVKYVIQIVILLVTKKYLNTIIISIIMNILLNFVVSIIINKQYKELFAVKAHLTKKEKKVILKDTSAFLCHRIGGTILNSTDMIMVSAFIGLGIGGIYSNYTMIISAMAGIISQIFAVFMSSIGNLHAINDENHEYSVFKRLMFANFWITTLASSCLFVLLNPFIELWLDTEMVLNIIVVMTLVTNFYLNANRKIISAFITATGLFIKDKLRPFIEAAANVGFSLFFVYLFSNENIMGNYYAMPNALSIDTMKLMGIFLGTFCSLTFIPIWREVMLLYKYNFKKKQFGFWKRYLFFLISTILIIAVSYYICSFIPNSLGYVILKFIIMLTFPNVVLIVLTFRTKEFKYYFSLVKVTLSAIKDRLTNKKKK